MTARARNGRFTAERTTETTTQRVTERITVEEADTLTDGLAYDDVLVPARGWDPNTGYTGISARELREQRDGQIERDLRFLWLWAESNPLPPEEMTAIHAAVYREPGPQDHVHHAAGFRSAAAALGAPGSLVRDGAVILRAGPFATPLEQHLGRSI